MGCDRTFANGFLTPRLLAPSRRSGPRGIARGRTRTGPPAEGADVRVIASSDISFEVSRAGEQVAFGKLAGPPGELGPEAAGRVSEPARADPRHQQQRP